MATKIKTLSKKVARGLNDGEPSRAAMKLTDVLHALSDDVRLDMVRQIARVGEKACGTFGVGVPKSSLSHHFRVLRESGVLTIRREGKELLNSIRAEDLDARFPGLLRAVVGAISAPRAAKRQRATTA